jgi:hypothetical protein
MSVTARHPASYMMAAVPSGRLAAPLLFSFFFILSAALSIPGGMSTPLSFSASDPQCASPNFANNWLDCHSPEPARAGSTLDDIITIFSDNDEAAYARGAKGLVEGSSDWRAMTSIYPPGIMVLEAIPYSLSRNAPIGLFLVGVTSSLWAIAFTLMAKHLLRSSATILLAITVPALMMLLPDMRGMTRSFFFLTEPICTASLLCAGGFLASAAEREGLAAVRPAALAGVFLAVAMYFRAAVGFMVVSLAVLAVLLGLLVGAETLVRRHRGPSGGGARASSLRDSLLPIATALTFFALTAGPYWLANHGRWVNSKTSYVWSLVWKRPAEFAPEWQFFVEGGGPAGCVIDPATCDYVHEGLSLSSTAFTNQDFFYLTIRTALHHPVAWLRYKLSFIARGWFDDTPSAVVASILLLSLLLAGALSGNPPAFTLMVMLVAVLAGTVGPLLLVHVEPRYLMPLRLFVLYSVVLTAALLHRYGGRGRATGGHLE